MKPLPTIIKYASALVAVCVGFTIVSSHAFRVTAPISPIANQLGDLVGKKSFDGEMITVNLTENCNDIPYYVVKYYDEDSVLLVRKNPTIDKVSFNHKDDYRSQYNYYPGSTVDTWLEEEFYERYSDYVKHSLLSTKLETTTLSMILKDNLKNDTEFIHRRVFILSCSELGLTINSDAAKEGRKAVKADATKDYWTRTPSTKQNDICYATDGEDAIQVLVTDKLSVRPAVTMPCYTHINRSIDSQTGRTVYSLD